MFASPTTWNRRAANLVGRWLTSWLAAAGLLAMLGGCTVSVEPKPGADPCDPNPCQTTGACGGWTGTCTASKDDKAICSNWKWGGQGPAPVDGTGKPLATPEGYEANETKCDGQDNDCDGLTDESFVADISATCGAKGVCASVSPSLICAGGKLVCELPVAAAYEASETTCDGKDNDCDGETDETVSAPAGTCTRLGVCGGLPQPTCDGGQWLCGYEAAADYEAAEVSCDGKDNDCDGQVDMGLSSESLSGSASCKTTGVCSAVAILCQAGQPTCDYNGVAAYESFEQTCDGKDNDCDGKTDNLAGSAVPLTVASDASCKAVGVCAAGKIKISRVCSAGALTCDYSAVPGFEVKEASCDGKDNDCDGQTDEELVGPAQTVCGANGLCKAGKALCNAGLWQCDYAALTAQGYEAFEQTCDGKDNDCDGQTDEHVTPAQAGCLAAGACVAGVTVSCAVGKPTCSYALVKGYEATEASCDGVDNDCDGQTDEPAGLSTAAAGCSVGVCAGKANATCSSGKWSCDTAAISDFEAAETTCDGKDNDCDGQTDESLVSTSACPNKGVCSTGVTGFCVGGKYLCDTANLTGFEAKETLCDGLDNDCDGSTDVGLCPATSKCTADNQCVSGTCTNLSGGSGKVCAATNKGCAQAGSGGSVNLIANGSGICSTATTALKCNNAAFAAPQNCSGATPFCEAGACVLCKPNAIACDDTDPMVVVKCNAEGTADAPIATCDAGSKCGGSGACVPDAAVGLAEAADVVTGLEVTSIGNGFAAAWIAEIAGSPSLFVRVFDAEGTPIGPATVGHGSLKPVKGSRIGIAAAGSGFAVTWVATSTGKDIALGVYSATGTVVTAPAVVNSNLNQGDQDLPALASNANHLVIVWSGDETDFVDSGVCAQRLTLTGSPAGEVIIANDDFANSDSPISDNQENAVVAMRDNGQFAVVWAHRNAQNRNRVRGRLFGSNDQPASGVVTISSGSTSSNQTQPTLTWNGTVWLVAWTSDTLEGTGTTGIGLRAMSTAFATQGTVSAANSTTAGAQSAPRLMAQADGNVVLAWNSVNQHSGTSAGDVVRRLFGPTGTSIGAEKVLADAPGEGDQNSARPVTFADGRRLMVWLSNTTGVFLPVAQFD